MDARLRVIEHVTESPRKSRPLVVRATEIARRRGIRGLWFALLGETVYRRLALLERPLEATMPTIATGVPVAVAPLAPAEVEEYVLFRGGDDPHAVLRRLEAGEWCFVARHEGTMVQAGWAVTGSTWIDYLGCALPLAVDEVYGGESFTAPPFRGLGIAAERIAREGEFLWARGYRRLVGTVLPENTSGFGPLVRLGYTRVGWIGVIRLGRWRRGVGTRPVLFAARSSARGPFVTTADPRN